MRAKEESTPAVSPRKLRTALKEYFGYDSFRPLQEEIITAAMAGEDVFALLPTGGGKSLCFQLPAVIRPGLTLVVSPLIALMKDQVDALSASGIPAAFLNSTLDAADAKRTLRNLYNGDYKLLYAAPERLMLEGFSERLREWNLAQIAIDEAHCISEWGHDFRPEYRQISRMRREFPDVPVMALTATATERVREDIVKQLKLREPRSFAASFNRPNLTYRVIPKDGPLEQAMTYLKARRNESGIIYCQSRKAAESVAERLSERGVRAVPYHAGLTPEVRARHQEWFLRDEVQVVCATIAFGMGINKPNVRFVLHYDLPKNLEGYYQETGRAGRDGLPSECLLLFTPADVAKQMKFIEEKPDAKEREVAQAQLRQMVHFAESAGCRRVSLLGYFGEVYPPEGCGACDNCLNPRATFDGTLPAQKFLSCIYRLQAASRFGVGLNHLVDVLMGADNEKIRRWGHETLSTYGIGKEHSRNEWQHIGRELMRLGFCEQVATDRFSTVELTGAGLRWLKARTPLQMSRPMEMPAKSRSKEGKGSIPCDEALFEKLRVVRKQIADLRDVAAYVVFSDVALRHMARDYPQGDKAFANIPGVGARKLSEFGKPFMAAIREHLASEERLHFPPLR